ncbi:hypothetical protein HYW74_04860 [Candidatus Pacearchaeota archaeon]|nr:hypothetical protein [Candidatus Pacearchaeota archaeon]
MGGWWRATSREYLKYNCEWGCEKGLVGGCKLASEASEIDILLLRYPLRQI